MLYLGPIILALLLWTLNYMEQKNEVPNEKYLFFYKVITAAFTVMQLVVLPTAKGTTAHVIFSLLVVAFSLLVTVLICLPVRKLPKWYKVKLQIRESELDLKEQELESPASEPEESLK